MHPALAAIRDARDRIPARLSLASDETGSAVVEFVLVGALLTVLTLSVIQLGITLLVRNTVLDAASEGARYAALADNDLADGANRTRDLITTAIGPTFATHVSVARRESHGRAVAVVTVTTPLPIIGLVGIDHGLTVRGHAAVETLP